MDHKAKRSRAARRAAARHQPAPAHPTGPLQVGVGTQNGLVVLAFPEPLTTCSFAPVEARQLGVNLLRLANQIEGKPDPVVIGPLPPDETTPEPPHAKD